MKQETITRVKLIASDGNMLTNGDVYGKEVFLASSDDAENWHEITDAEYAAILDEQSKAVIL